jgi:hypothetical protein
MVHFFHGTGVLTQDFALDKQVLYLLSHSSSPFSLIIFEIGSHILPILDLDLPILSFCQGGASG